MTFLSPIPALIAAAITVPALLLLYFLKLRRRPVRVSSTLLWIQATRDLQVNVPFRWLRVTWLLVLQLLILALFLLALARPALHMPGAAAARIILLLDRSASMSAREPGSVGTRLDAAKARAARFIAELGRGSGDTSFSVVSFALQPAILTNFSGDRGAATQAINAITPTDQPAEIAAALRLASAMLAGDTDESGPRQPGLVVLFSDGAFASDQNLTLAGAEFRFERIGPAPPATDAPDPGPDNLGIVAFSARRDRDDPGAVRIFARFLNASRRELGAPIVVTLDGKEIERRAILVPAANPSPGETAATFDLRSRDGGIVELRIDRPDALEADNSAALVLPAATKPRILLVVPDSPSAAPVLHPTHWVIANILDELELPYRVMPASAFESDAASRSLGRADLIIFDAVLPRTLPAIPSLSFGAGLPLAEFPVEGPGPYSGYFISWRRTHAILRDLSLDSVFVSHAISLPESVLPSAGTLTELAHGPSRPFIVELEQGSLRRIVVAFDPADSTWPLSAGFPIFLAATIDYLTLRADENAGRSFTTAEPAQIDPPGISGTLTLDGPGRLTAQAPSEPGPVTLGCIERVGIYRLNGAPDSTPPTARTVAVNLLDPTESSLAARESFRVGGETVPAQTSGSGPRELWPWAVLAALVLLSIEWFLNAWLMRA